MQAHTLGARKNKKAQRIARGGKRGSFSGRGIKGQKARAGRRIRPEMRDVIQKIPKKKGYRQTRPPMRTVIIRAVDLAKRFKAGDSISPKILIKKRIIRRLKGKTPIIKVLGDRTLLKGYTISDLSFTKGQ